jgi:hypothetical protein
LVRICKADSVHIVRSQKAVMAELNAFCTAAGLSLMSDAQNNAVQIGPQNSAEYDQGSDLSFKGRKRPVPGIVITWCEHKAECKCKRLRFSSYSFLRVVYIGENESQSQGSAIFEARPKNASKREASHASTSSSYEDVIDTQEPTKHVDGPSPALIVIQKFLSLVKQAKKINREQVMDILYEEEPLLRRSEPESMEEEKCPLAVSTDSQSLPRNYDKLLSLPRRAELNSGKDENHLLAGATDCQSPPQGPNQLPSSPVVDFTWQVLTRLHALASRIEANGKAALLPCGTTVGRPYLPVIRFLASCVGVCRAPRGRLHGAGLRPLSCLATDERVN